MSEQKFKRAAPPRPRGPHGPRGFHSTEKAKDFKGAISKLLKYMGKYRVALIFVMVFAALSTIFTILGPRFLGMATTSIFSSVMGMATGESSGIDFEYLGKLAALLVVLYALSSAFSYFQGFLMSKVSVSVTFNMRKDISQKINKLPLSYFDKTSYGEVMSYITNDIDVITQSLNQSITQIITSVTTIIGILIIMFTMSWQMTLIALCVIPVSAAVLMIVVKHSQKYFAGQQEYLGKVNGHIEEMYSNHIVMTAFNGQLNSIEEFDGLNGGLYTTAWKSQFFGGLMMPVMSFISNLGYVAICIFGGYMAVNGALTVGEIQAFIQYVRQFTQPLNQLAQISNILQQTAAAAERVFEFLEEPDENPDPALPASTEGLKGKVLFDHITFGYNPDKIIIKDFTALIEPGQKVAIVGHTGAGKTTIIKLLMRFYEVNGGAIKIDGININDFTRDSLRSMFGMVLQEAWLESDTIMENIRFGRLDATDEEVYAAAKNACADHFIRALPQGYETEINEDSTNISLGQKQLLTIARVFLEDPKMLILDEATSSIDTRTEMQIQQAMDNLMKGRTSFVIAHRLSTIKNADIIFVMEDGDIAEFGNHDELMAKGGAYAELYKSQFEQAE